MTTIKISPAVLVEHIRQLDKHGHSQKLDELIQGREQQIVVPVDLVKAIKAAASELPAEGKQVLSMRCGAMPCIPWE